MFGILKDSPSSSLSHTPTRGMTRRGAGQCSVQPCRRPPNRVGLASAWTGLLLNIPWLIDQSSVSTGNIAARTCSTMTVTHSQCQSVKSCTSTSWLSGQSEKPTWVVRRRDPKHNVEYYTFGESTWDLVIFIGTGALGPLGSLQTLILALVNVVMQVVFVGIAWVNFSSPDITDTTIQEAFMWRRSSGHSLAEYDTVSKESLAQRVCNLDKSLHISGIQVDLVENIRKYLNSEGSGIALFFSGQVLCLVALICWYLMVAKEVSHALALHRGVAAVARGPTEIATRENPFTQVTYYRLVRMARRRKIMSALLLLYRLVAAGFLIYVGTFFLVYTVNVTELILNAVALGIILDIDDLLFDALATTPGRHLVHQLDPLPMPAFPRFRGADAKSTTMTFLIPGLTLLIYFSMVSPFVQTLTDVENSFCGGNKAFVWSMDKRQVVLLAPTDGGGWDNQTETIQQFALQEATDLQDTSNPRLEYGVWLQNVASIYDLDALTLEELVSQTNKNCEDMANEVPLLNYLRDVLGNQSITGCSDAVQYCNSLTKMPSYELDGGMGYTTRMFCPETCGCNNPGGEFANIQGCPFNNGEPCRSSDAFRAYRQSATCFEMTAEELRNHTPWLKRIEAIRAYAESEGNFEGKSEAWNLSQAMYDHGCDFRNNLTDMNITWGNCFGWEYADWEFKTLDWFCPQTCNCPGQGSDLCPQPNGKTCSEVESCLFYEGAYYCPGNRQGETPTYSSELTLDVADTDILNTYSDEVLQGLKVFIADVVGNGVEPWMVEVAKAQSSGSGPPGRRLASETYEYTVYLVDQKVSSDLTSKTLQQQIQELDTSQMVQQLETALNATGVPVEDLSPA
eukprot:s633_g13.t3